MPENGHALPVFASGTCAKTHGSLRAPLTASCRQTRWTVFAIRFFLRQNPSAMHAMRVKSWFCRTRLHDPEI